MAIALSTGTTNTQLSMTMPRTTCHPVLPTLITIQVDIAFAIRRALLPAHHPPQIQLMHSRILNIAVVKKGLQRSPAKLLRSLYWDLGGRCPVAQLSPIRMKDPLSIPAMRLHRKRRRMSASPHLKRPGSGVVLILRKWMNLWLTKTEGGPKPRGER